MKKSIWHTSTLSEFNAKIYDGLLKHEHVTSDEVVKKFQEDDYYGYELEKDNPTTKLKDRYFVQTTMVHKLPIKVIEQEKFSHRSEAFHMVLKAETRKIPTQKMMLFRELVDFYANYAHDNPDHWKLAKLIILAAYCERVNIRIVSPASFGKDGLVDILRLMNGSVANLYNATLAKLKYALINDLIIINELGGLKQEDIGSMQVYLTQAGAYKPQYENNSRGVNGVKETMDLQKKSHVVFHNTPDYYSEKGQKYFEEMFTKAVADRLPGILVTGYVKEDFSQASPIDSFSQDEINALKAFIATLNWFKANPIQTARFTVPDDFWGFRGKEMQRSLRSFKILSKYFAEYAKDQVEFEKICGWLRDCRFDYVKIAGKNANAAKEDEPAQHAFEDYVK